VGLARWLEAAEGYLACELAILDAAAKLAARHAELAGRLAARRAQLAAIAGKGAHVDPSLEALARAAEIALQRRPSPLDVATVSLESFESKLAATVASLKK
jgi:hypothetical protein